MELAEGATVTHHPRERTIPQLCHRGSERHCSLTVWWVGEAALEKNHTFLKRVETRERRWSARAEMEASSWPLQTPKGSPLARTPGRVLSSCYRTVSHALLWNVEAKREFIYKCRNLNDVYGVCVRKTNTGSISLEYGHVLSKNTCSPNTNLHS